MGPALYQEFRGSEYVVAYNMDKRETLTLSGSNQIAP